MPDWDHSCDLVIVGSGGGGLVAGLAAADAGLKPIILEKQGIVGGSTAMSGGILWLPNNPVMRADGGEDSLEDGLAYMDAVVGDVGPASSLARREMFLTAGSEMVSFLLAKGVQLVRCRGYSDYYPNHKGGNAEGRAIEGVPFDLRELGEWQDKLPPPFSSHYGLVFKTNEIRRLPYFNRAPEAFLVAARVWLRTQLAKLRGQELVANGASLVGQLVKALLADRVPLWLNIGVEELVFDEGRVAGVRIVRDGLPVSIEARKGVLLAAGGFSHNADMRRQYSGNQPNEAQWSGSNLGDTGEMLAAAIALGARTDLMDEAIWSPTPRPELGLSSIALARQRPGAIMVNRAAQRFCNEGNDYIEVGKAMYANDAIPAWLIFDDGYRRRYRATAKDILPSKFPQEWFDNGWVKKASTVEALAGQIGVDPAALAATVKRFNANAAMGLDPDFGRGQSAFNLCWGDPGYKPNGALGPLNRAPYYATEIYPGGRRDLRRRGDQRVRSGPRSRSVTDPRALRRRKHHGHADGSPLSRSGSQYRQHHCVRLRGCSPRRRASHEGKGPIMRAMSVIGGPRRRVAAVAAAACIVALASCSSSSKSSSSSTSSGPGSSSSATPATSGGSGGGFTASQIQWATNFLGSKPGAADPSLSPVVFGWVNPQGGTLSFPENTSAMQATVDFINKDLGGIDGHPLVAHTCFATAASDSLKCGEQMANDGAVKAIVSAEFELDNQAFYNAIQGKKPYLNGQLVFPIDYTTPNVYSYYPTTNASSIESIYIAQNILHAKRMIVIRTDNPAGLAAFQGLAGVAKASNLDTVQVPVPEPGTDPQYTAAISAVNPKPGDVILMYITAIGGVSVYDALQSLHLTNLPVIGGELMLLPPMPGHLKDLGLKDAVYPNNWYFPVNGYSELIPTPNSNGADVYVAMMHQFAPKANIHGAATTAFGDTMAIAKLLTEAGGPAASSGQVGQEMKDFTGTAPLNAAPEGCGALKSEPNACYFTFGLEQRLNGQWVSVADGYNGKAVNLLPLLQKTSR